MSRQATKTFTVTGVGIATTRKTVAATKSVTGVGAVSLVRQAAATRTATGTGVVVLVKQASHSLSASGVGLASATPVKVLGGPQSGFMELFIEAVATTSLMGSPVATMTFDVKALATMDLFMAKVG
jgi:hypothetical protein